MNIQNIIDQMSVATSGDHMVMLYDNDDYNTDIIAAYILSRLYKNEKCFYISGDSDVELLKAKLRTLTNLNKYTDSGQLSFLTKNDAYAKDGYFDPDTMIKLLQQLSEDAVKEGYNAFSITGEISWVLKFESGFDKIMEYEYKLNKFVFDKYPVSAVCRYNINMFSSKMIKSIIEVHPYIIWKGEIHDNPFYTESVDETEVDVDDYYVESMIQRITEFTNTKSRVNLALKEKEKAYDILQVSLMKSIILSLTGLLEIHDIYTKNHSENVAKIAKEIAIKMELSDESISKIYFAGLVHDIGKTIIPAEIINKTTKLTDDEFDMIKMHSSYGYDALSKTDELKDIAKIVRQHHEHYNGKGYPLGNSGENIPLGSRILSVADAYDAMINDRPYRKALTIEKVLNEIDKYSGIQFDPQVVKAFQELISDKRINSDNLTLSDEHSSYH